MHKFIKNLDTTPITWYLQAELLLRMQDWLGMTQNFITTFLFESDYPIVDQALKIIRQRIFWEVDCISKVKANEVIPLLI